MKALSVRAPWWWAILHGKPVENRGWPTNFRGRVWIHASKFWKMSAILDDLEDIRDMEMADHISLPYLHFPEIEALRDSGGCIVGSVEIVDCVKSHPSAFFVGEYGFVLRDPIILPKPVPFKGMLGFFDVPDFGETEHPSPFPTGVEA